MSGHFMLNETWYSKRPILIRCKMPVFYSLERLIVITQLYVFGHFDFALVVFFFD